MKYNNYYNTKKESKAYIYIIIILIAVIVAMILYYLIQNEYIEPFWNKKEAIDIVFESVEENEASLELFTIYGNMLNVEGYIDANYISATSIDDMSLVLVEESQNIEIYEYELEYEKSNNKYTFTLSENINEGINLDSIAQSDYYIFLKISQDTISNGESTTLDYLYSLDNISDYSDTTYYTLTENDENREITISFDTYIADEETEIEYFKISSKVCELPEDVYDIVIDAGHGGSDVGASSDGNYESDYTLEYALLLRDALEELGYKVKLTREEDVRVTSYGEGGRAIISYEVQAKLLLSIHLNSADGTVNQGGVEVYAPNNANLDFAKLIADNVVDYASTTYSVNPDEKVYDGVYVWTFSEEDIEESIQYANEAGFEPYENLTTATNYLFMIRETGGIMTGAYMDGRNTDYDENPYYDSNVGAESYLLELGFINNEADIDNLDNNSEAYISAIVDSIVEHYNSIK